MDALAELRTCPRDLIPDNLEGEIELRVSGV